MSYYKYKGDYFSLYLAYISIIKREKEVLKSFIKLSRINGAFYPII